MRNPPADHRCWTAAGAALVLLAAALAFLRAGDQPYVLDSWFHLAMVEGFRQAGGPVLHAFWESAPQGHPQIYPPLFHLLWLPPLAAGAAPLMLVRLWCASAFPVLLAVVLLVLRRTTTPRLAFLAAAAVAAPFCFFLSAVNYPPATYALCAGLGLLLALHRDRPLAGGLLLAAAFWLHAGIPWLLLISLGVFGLIEPLYRKRALRIAAIGLAGAAPWLAHVAMNLDAFRPRPHFEDSVLDTAPLMIALGLCGFAAAWRARGKSVRFLCALAIGFLPLIGLYRFRYFSAYGLFTLLLLAGVALDRAADRWRGWIWPAAAALLLVSPGIYLLPGPRPWLAFEPADSTAATLAGRRSAIPRGSMQLLFPEDWKEAAAASVLRNSGKDDLLFCNHPYIASMLTGLTGRSSTTSALREVPGRAPDRAAADARLILWISGFDQETRPPAAWERQLQLEALEQTELSRLYRNNSAAARRGPLPPALPWAAAVAAVAAVVGLIIWDMKRP